MFIDCNRRWFVLTPHTLYSFKEFKVYKNPTEVISLKSINTIKSAEDETNKPHTFVNKQSAKSSTLLLTTS